MQTTKGKGKKEEIKRNTVKENVAREPFSIYSAVQWQRLVLSFFFLFFGGFFFFSSFLLPISNGFEDCYILNGLAPKKDTIKRAIEDLYPLCHACDPFFFFSNGLFYHSARLPLFMPTRVGNGYLSPSPLTSFLPSSRPSQVEMREYRRRDGPSRKKEKRENNRHTRKIHNANDNSTAFFFSLTEITIRGLVNPTTKKGMHIGIQPRFLSSQVSGRSRPPPPPPPLPLPLLHRHSRKQTTLPKRLSAFILVEESYSTRGRD